jgi:hypothetical protein
MIVKAEGVVLNSNVILVKALIALRLVMRILFCTNSQN